MSEDTATAHRLISTVAHDAAEAEFDRFVEAMDLDFNVDRMDAEERKSFEDQKHVVVTAIERGHLVVDDKGQPVYTPVTGNREPITFFEPTGATIMASDTKKRGHDQAKVFSILADMTRQPEKRFAVMPQRDLKVCRSLWSLFLG